MARLNALLLHGWMYLLIAAALVASNPGVAATYVEPGEKTTLGRGEGLLVLAISTNYSFNTLQIERLDGMFAGSLGGANAGDSLAIMKAPAGRYRITRIELDEAGTYVDWRARKDLGFTVTEGTISYPGHIELEASGTKVFSLSLVNRAARAASHIQHRFGSFLEQFPLAFTGNGTDPYPQFLREQRAKVGSPAIAAASVYSDKPQSRGLDPTTLFDPDGVHQVRISPDGKLLAEIARAGSRWVVNLVDLRDGSITELFRGAHQIIDVVWAGPERLIIQAWAENARYRAVVVGIERDKTGALKTRATPVPYEGMILGRVEGAPNVIIFARMLVDGDDSMQLYRVDVTQDQVKHAQFRRQDRLDLGLGNDHGWLFDRAGRMRVAVVRRDGKQVVIHRDADEQRWRDLMTVDADVEFRPVALANDGGGFYAITDLDRKQQELVLVSTTGQSAITPVLAIAGIDIESALIRPSDGTVIGAKFHRDAAEESMFLDEGLQSLQAAMRNALPGMRVAIHDSGANGRKSIVLADSATHPGAWYLLDRDAGTLEIIGEVAPRLAKMSFAQPEVFAVDVGGGTMVQSIIFLPAANGPVPLVVMPHGGPIGVRDTLAFDRQAQFLVSRGFAVLQVNYRGSAGFGRDFLTAGHGNWGRQIEDDIERAIDHALANYPLDPKRVGLVGASYGGYSALMGLVRAPARFRCAVSIAGVTDIPLMFTSSDWATSPDYKQQMRRIAGDPETQLDSLREISPVYRYADITKPVLLVHGRDDKRVVSDHSERLRQMLALVGRKADIVVLENEGHAISSHAAQVKMHRAIAAFLDTHLLPADAAPEAGAASPPRGSDGIGINGTPH